MSATETNGESSLAVMEPDTASKSVFDRVPNELKLEIFSFIRKSKDFSRSRLVCSLWDRLIAPMAWETFRTSLQNTSDRNIGDLVCNNSAFRHTRKLVLDRGSSTIEDSEFEYNLRLILGTVKPDTLRTFASFCQVNSGDLLQLLRSQSRLSCLLIPANFGDLPSSYTIGTWLSLYSPLVSQSLSAVRTLGLAVETEIQDYEERISFGRLLLRSTMTDIEALTIRGEGDKRTRHDVLNDLFLTFNNGQTALQGLKVVTLTIRKIQFNRVPSVMLDALDLKSLQNLRLSQCLYSSPFLFEVAHRLRQMNHNINSFEISGWSPFIFPRSVEPIEAILESGRSMQSIMIDSPIANWVSEISINHHRSRLQSLLLSGFKPRSVEYIRAILSECTQIRQLGMWMPEVELGSITEPDFSLGFLDSLEATCPQTELHAMLSAVANAPNLHTLRILSIGGIADLPQDRKFTTVQIHMLQAIMSNYATKVLQYFVNHGSKIKFLAISPLKPRPNRASPEDINGHRYPHYYYTRARTTDCTGRTSIAAQPVEFCREEFVESTIFQH